MPEPVSEPRQLPNLLNLPVLGMVKWGVDFDREKHLHEPGTELSVFPDQILYCYGKPDSGVTSIITADGSEHLLPVPSDDFRTFWLQAKAGITPEPAPATEPEPIETEKEN